MISDLFSCSFSEYQKESVNCFPILYSKKTWIHAELILLRNCQGIRELPSLGIHTLYPLIDRDFIMKLSRTCSSHFGYKRLPHPHLGTWTNEDILSKLSPYEALNMFPYLPFHTHTHLTLGRLIEMQPLVCPGAGRVEHSVVVASGNGIKQETKP